MSADFFRKNPSGVGCNHVKNPGFGNTVAEGEQELIIETLTHCLGNLTHAANILGISIRTLRNKLKLYTEQDVIVPSPGNRNEQAAT